MPLKLWMLFIKHIRCSQRRRCIQYYVLIMCSIDWRSSKYISTKKKTHTHVSSTFWHDPHTHRIYRTRKYLQILAHVLKEWIFFLFSFFTSTMYIVIFCACVSELEIWYFSTMITTHFDTNKWNVFFSFFLPLINYDDDGWFSTFSTNNKSKKTGPFK